jgi:Prophage minor tail protein Z (GPZ)
MPAVFSIKPEGFKEAEAALAHIDGAYPVVASRAINRALGTGKKVVAQAVSGRYNLKSGDVKDNVAIHKATRGDPWGEMELQGNMLPVRLFKPSGGKKLKTGKRQPIKVAIIKQRWKVLRRAFKAPNGQIMERRQPERLPIFPISTISVAHMAGQVGVAGKVEEEMARTLALQLENQTKEMLRKEGFK